MKVEFLSYYINLKTPLYGGDKTIDIKEKSSILNGASSNTKIITFPNHTGTHIDFPNHFSNEGKTINDYSASFWVFENVFVLNYRAEKDGIIKEEVLNNIDIPEECEFLILYTGFGKYRDKNIYWNHNPGLSPTFANTLRKKCPNIKAIGFDFISLSSYQNRELGRKAHKSFLLGNDILVIEDMKLDNIKDKKIRKIVALPLLIDGSDGSPITISAEYA